MANNNESDIIKDFGFIQKTDDTQTRIAIKSFKDKQYLDIRDWWLPKDKDDYLPTKKGITISIEDSFELLQDFHNKITEAYNFLEELEIKDD